MHTEKQDGGIFLEKVEIRTHGDSRAEPLFNSPVDPLLDSNGEVVRKTLFSFNVGKADGVGLKRAKLGSSSGFSKKFKGTNSPVEVLRPKKRTRTQLEDRYDTGRQKIQVDACSEINRDNLTEGGFKKFFFDLNNVPSTDNSGSTRNMEIPNGVDLLVGRDEDGGGRRKSIRT
ncbi:hypothetical protein Hanom_Chr06g00551771 [Helianthus anomalus]